MQEEEPVEEGEEVEQQPDEQPSSTTETTKKFLKSGVVRPFRSNDDLLATLKRRREQAALSELTISILVVISEIYLQREVHISFLEIYNLI